MASPASDFQKFITDARERKKNSALANRIFSRDRRQSAPSKLKPTPGGSLASRVGVKKRAPVNNVTNNTRRSSLPAGNVNGEWTHDLHDTVKNGSLSSRITKPGSSTHAHNNHNYNQSSSRSSNGTAPRAPQRRAKLATALDRMDVDQVNIVSPSTAAAAPAGGMGLTIRGLAGPFAVMGQNFAPGTTAADIESAMTPVGGEMVSCRIVKTQPFLIAEMVFSSREGGERVIETFDNKTADGRVLKMYPKIGGYKPSASNRSDPSASAPGGPTGSRDQFVDGSMGFPDVSSLNPASGSSSKGSGTHRFYSDDMVRGFRKDKGFRSRGGR